MGYGVCEGERETGRVDVSEKPQALIDAEIAVNDALAKRYETQHRIAAGERYVGEHPGDPNAEGLLEVLRRKEQGQWKRYEKLLRQYEQVSDEVCGRQWPLEDSTHEGMDVRQGVSK